jgi:hypothetical protein
MEKDGLLHPLPLLLNMNDPRGEKRNAQWQRLIKELVTKQGF